MNLQPLASPRWIHAVQGSLRSHLLRSEWFEACFDLNLRRRHSLQETGMRLRRFTWRVPCVPSEILVSSESLRSDGGAGFGGSSSSSRLDIVVVQQLKQEERRTDR